MSENSPVRYAMEVGAERKMIGGGSAISVMKPADMAKARGIWNVNDEGSDALISGPTGPQTAQDRISRSVSRTICFRMKSRRRFMYGLTPELSRLAYWTQRHGTLFLPWLWCSEACSAGTTFSLLPFEASEPSSTY